ncbi:MAG: peroxiredoxin [Acidimicrobiaceae bacterium]|nr:peroxiredoxin [Acidimicrobiaceae bacterium]
MTLTKSSIEVGSRAPDFKLMGTGGASYSLSQYLGKTVVLVFYPGDNTPVCTKQLCSYNNELEQFANLDAQVVAISSQDVASHEAFSKKHGFKFPLLAYTDKQVSSDYGVLGLFGLSRRSIFVIDAKGIVRYVHRAVTGVTFRRVGELTEAIANAQAGND